MSDYLVRGIAAGGTVRAFAVDTTETVETARQKHEMLNVGTAALGRLMSAGAMMGSTMKGDKDIVSLTIKGNGPLVSLTVSADSKGNVKGFVANPKASIPRKYEGKLDVGNAVGEGTLTVVMDLGLAEPYCGTVELQSGEIGDDLAYYFATSEQTPSIVGVGVMMAPDDTVKHSGGYFVQLMPNVEEETIEKLEAKLATLDSATTMLEKGFGPEQMLESILGDMDLELTEKKEVRFHCNCSKERYAAGLATIDRADLEEMIAEGKEIEVKCFFCNSAYYFSPEELQEILDAREAEE